MKPELQDQIIQSHPLLFAKLQHLEVEDGWFDLLMATCACIEQELKLVPLELKGEVYAVQVKQKFGELRFYTNYHIPKIEGIICLAETLSLTICESCGKKGQRGTHKHYISVQCNDCQSTQTS